MSHIASDVRSALREGRRSPLASLMGVASAALGVGVCTALFAAFDTLVPRDAGVPDPSTLVVGPVLSPDEYGAAVDITTPGTSWAFSVRGVVTLEDRAVGNGILRETIVREWVSPEYFDVMGIEPNGGRFFGLGDSWRDRPVVLSHSFWRSHFGGDPTCLGRVVRYRSGQGGVVVGIAPPAFDARFVEMSHVSLWQLAPDPGLPGFLAEIDKREGEARTLRVFVRVTNTTVSDVRRTIAAAIARCAPGATRAGPPWASTVARLMRRRWTGFLAITMLLPIAVLLIATTNVAVLLLSDIETHKNELAIRLALGCGRLRLLRLVLTKAVLVIAVGTLIGIAFAWLAARYLSATGQLVQPQFRMSTVSAAIGFGALAAVVAALSPALFLLRGNHSAELRTGGMLSGGSTRALRAHGRLVVFQVGMSFALIAAAAFCLQPLFLGSRLDLGFDSHGVSVAFATPGEGGREVVSEMEAWMLAAESLPGTSSSVWLSTLPGEPLPLTSSYVGPNQPGESQRTVSVAWRGVSPGYFTLVKATLLAGRMLGEYDVRSTSNAVVVDEALARQLGGLTIVGGLLRMDGPQSPPHEIVGVVRDPVRADPTVRIPIPMVYLPVNVAPSIPRVLLVRSAAESSSTRAELTRRLRRASKLWWPADVRSLPQALSRSRRIAMVATFAAPLAGLALILALAAIYASLAYTTALRAPEIGVRVALGASPGGVRWLLVKRAVVLTGWGLAFGLALGALLIRILRAAFEGLPSSSALAFLAAGSCLVLVAVVASYIPARRASAVDPAVTFRDA